MGSTVPKLARRVDLLLKHLLISSVWIITIIWSFSSSADSDVVCDLFKKVVGYFKSLTRTIMSSELWNYLRMYCLIFSLNFLFWYLASLRLDVVPKTAPKSSTSPLKFLVDNVYDGRLKPPPLPPRHWWPPLTVQSPWLSLRPQLLEMYLLVSEAQVVVESLLSLTLLSAAGEAVSFFYSFCFTLFYSSFLNTFKLTLLSFSRVVHNPTCL